MKRLLANFDPADQESLENSVNLGKLDNPGGGNHGILGPHGKREQVLPSPHSLVFIPCIRCVPWLTTERIFYHGTLGPHGKREQVLPSPHALVFISVYSVCSVVTFLGLGFRRHPSRIGYAQFVVRIAGHDKQQVAQTV
jgi:hypothetical protein